VHQTGLKQPGSVFLDFDCLRGTSSFNGIDGGPYGARDINGNGKVTKDECKLIDSDFTPDRDAGKCPAFGIRHYAAEVSYDCRGWVEKDKNNPTVEMKDCLSGSSDTAFMQPVFAAPPAAGKASVTAAFCSSLGDLITILGCTDMNFVRCLKASNPLAKRVFQSALVLKQLKYTGMLDTLKIRTFGFPMRMGYSEFRGWAKILAPSVAQEPLELAVEEMVAYLQKTFTEEVFSNLPQSDQETKADQKAQVIVQGKPQDVVANMPVVMMRDWFHRGLDKKRKLLLKAHYEMISRVCKAAACAQPFVEMRTMCKAVVPSVQLFLAAAKEAHHTENATSQADLEATVAFNNENISLMESEAAERKAMAAEEAYGEEISLALYAGQIAANKVKYFNMAEDAYKTALESLAAANASLDNAGSQLSEIDAKWAKMESQAQVKSVPIIRQFKPTAAQMREISPDAVKFTFNF